MLEIQRIYSILCFALELIFRLFTSHHQNTRNNYENFFCSISLELSGDKVCTDCWPLAELRLELSTPFGCCENFNSNMKSSVWLY